VSTEAPGTAANVTNSGSPSKAVLNFGIPQGATGASGPGTGATAFGQVWMGSGTAERAPGTNSLNLQSVGGGGGLAAVQVTGCSAAGLAEPVIGVTADEDPLNSLPGHGTLTAGAYVNGWSHSGSVLTFDITTYAAAGGGTANSDFSFAVYC
ncbi:MAG: hypothetical protein KGL16_11425, partial [Acidobacteriota bacterium]|nr:hypothetical protein [Acidobacteriota bacterium]